MSLYTDGYRDGYRDCLRDGLRDGAPTGMWSVSTLVDPATESKLEAIIREAASIVGNTGLLKWLYIPIKALGNKSPMQIVEEGKVDDLLQYVKTYKDTSFS